MKILERIPPVKWPADAVARANELDGPEVARLAAGHREPVLAFFEVHDLPGDAPAEEAEGDFPIPIPE